MQSQVIRRAGAIAFFLSALGVVLCVAGSATAADPQQIQVHLKQHRWDPAEIHVPTDKPIILMIINEDDTPEEFDSTALRVEKVIAANHYATVHLRPLAPGRYPFMGEFHPETATGVVVSE